LLLVSGLQIPVDGHKLLLIGWTILFYGALAVHERDDYLKSPIPTQLHAATSMEPQGVDEFTDTDGIGIAHDEKNRI
jgi:hypothetical protein